MSLFLFHIEYSVVKTGMDFVCKVVGMDREDVLQDIISQVGEIRIISIYLQCEVNRITGTIRKQIVEKSISNEPINNSKVGRPKKYNFW